MSRFTDAFDRGTKGIEFPSVGTCYRCSDCQSNYGMSQYRLKKLYESSNLADEGSFSWSSCDWCNSSLGGDRYAAHGYLRSSKGRRFLAHFNICQDCLMYHANGDEPEEQE